MQRSMGFVLLLVGAVLLGWGIVSSESFVSEVSEFFTGEPSDKTMMLMGLSLVTFILGAVFVGKSPNQRPL